MHSNVWPIKNLSESAKIIIIWLIKISKKLKFQKQKMFKTNVNYYLIIIYNNIVDSVLEFLIKFRFFSVE